MPHFHGNVSAKHVHTDGSWSVAPTIGTVTSAATSITFTHSGAGTHCRLYVVGGSAGSWVSLGASPVTVTGLTANTEYVLELSADASTVADSESFGTLNPGVGGGDVTLTTHIEAGVGAAAASGLTATITIGSGITINCGVGLAAASGLQAQIITPTVIAAGVGVAQALGLGAQITVSGGTVIACGVGAAEASGLRAIIRTLGALPDYAEQPTTASSWSYKHTATLWSLVSRDEWGGQTVHAEPVLFLCDYAADGKRAVSASGDEFTTRLLVYTSLPGIKQGDMLKVGATGELDPYIAGAYEVRATTEFGDTFSASGPPDFRIAT